MAHAVAPDDAWQITTNNKETTTNRKEITTVTTPATSPTAGTVAKPRVYGGRPEIHKSLLVNV